MLDPADQASFRQVLGQYPTGVCIVTAITAAGERVGLVVGSFTSASLEPPLIAFFPARTSTTWPKIEAAGRFCVNILAAGQEPVCRSFASKERERFERVGYRESPSGGLILNGVVAWIDCALEAVLDAGDHFVVVARVLAMDVETSSLPLLFFQGGYGRFASPSLAAGNVGGALTDQLRNIDVVRPEIEQLASGLSARCIVTTRAGEDLVVTASATGVDAGAAATFVGARFPFAPPMGAVFVAWANDEEISRWLSAIGTAEERTLYRERVAAVRRRGYAVGLLSSAQREFAIVVEQLSTRGVEATPESLPALVRDLEADPIDLSPEVKRSIRHVTAPVFDRDGRVCLSITLYGFADPTPHGGIDAYVEHLLETAEKATQRLRSPIPN
jgi:flavin reductase (DIM6/NTAB) family NADH-FMN oxidoreductase RutF/DNA-binding IclR family transcriptional regulator